MTSPGATAFESNTPPTAPSFDCAWTVEKHSPAKTDTTTKDNKKVKLKFPHSR